MSEPVREELPAEEMPETQAAPEEGAQTPDMEIVPERMVWHGFLTRFLLILLPAYAVFQIVWIETGRVYYTAEIRERIYEGIAGMRALDRGLCLLLLGAAALLLCARGKLARRCRSGANLLLSGLGLAALAWALYGGVRYAIAGLSPMSVSVFGQWALYAALLLVNARYYARRRKMLIEKNTGERSQQ